ncbi:MAG TPA: ATP-binding protein [Acidimicrobiia bacterium]|nr:ATP-binding protein [Acidimicrobiia bacterium]
MAIGSPHPFLFEAGQEAFSTAQTARRSDPARGLAALAVPVRHRGVVIAALAVAGPAVARRPLEPDALLFAADCAALALAARPATSVLSGAGPGNGAIGVALVEGLARIAAAGTTDEVLAAALDVADATFGARAALVCLPAGPGGVEVVAWRGLDRDRIGAASRHPGFTRLISGSDLTVVAPTDATVAQLTAGAEFAVCLPLADGQPGALVLLVTEAPDATGRRALEALRAQLAAGLRGARSAAAVEAADAQRSALVQAMADPVLVVDGTGRFTALNPAAAELFALSDSFELGRPARGRLGHPGLEGLLLGIEGPEGDTASGGNGGTLADGAEVVLGRPVPRRFRATARSLGRDAGRVLVLRAAGAAPGAGREEADVVAALGRALRDPLAAITALSTAGPGGDGITSAADWEVVRKGIVVEAARIEAVADQIALLSTDGRAAATVAVRPEPVDVVAFVGMIVAARRAAHPDRELTLVAPARLNTSVDRRLLERVLDPLIDNALRYSDGPVSVEVADRGDSFEIAVLDAGPGIFSGDIPALFERFHPLDGSPGRTGGVSLYTGRRLTELLGGRLWCDSKLGLGSRFALRLPSDFRP